MYRNYDEWIKMIHYMDNALFFSNDDEATTYFEKRLSKKFHLSWMGDKKLRFINLYYITFAYNMNTFLLNCKRCFHQFLVRFWYVFGSFLILVWLQKPNQNQTKIYDFVVLFWSGLNPNQNQTDMYLHSYVNNIIVPYAIFLNWNTNGNDFGRIRKLQ